MTDWKWLVTRGVANIAPQKDFQDFVGTVDTSVSERDLLSLLLLVKVIAKSWVQRCPGQSSDGVEVMLCDEMAKMAAVLILPAAAVLLPACLCGAF